MSKWSKYLIEIKLQLLLAFPVMITFIMRKSVDVFSVIFIGHLNNYHYLAAAGIASVTANVTGYSLQIGFSSAISTLTSWAYGSNDQYNINLILQKSLIIIPLFICLPISILWYYSNYIMIYFGQNEIISNLANKYLIYCIPALYLRAINVILQNWLHSQNYVNIISFIVSFSAISNIGLLYLFMIYLNFGFIGAAISISVCRLIETLLLLLYIFLSKYIHNKSILNNFIWSYDCLKNWNSFFILAFPSLLMMLEWWASEILVFMSGLLIINNMNNIYNINNSNNTNNNDINVSTMSIYQNLVSICFMFPSCLRVAATTRIGNELGANNYNKAKICSYINVILALIISCIVSFILISFPTIWSKIYTNDIIIQNEVTKLIPLLSIYVIADGAQSALSGTIIGTGNQLIGGILVVIAYYIFGIPISYIYGFNRPKKYTFNLGVYGLCIGTVVGTWLHFIFFLITILFFTNWKYEAEKACKRLKEQKQNSFNINNVNNNNIISPNTIYSPIKNININNIKINDNNLNNDNNINSDDNTTNESLSHNYKEIELTEEELDDIGDTDDMLEDWDFGLDTFNDNFKYNPSNRQNLNYFQRYYYYLSDILFNTNNSDKIAHSEQYELVKSHLTSITDSIPYTTNNSNNNRYVSTNINDDEILDDDYDGLI